MRMLEWAHGKFQDAYESVRDGHTEWTCAYLSGQVPRRGSEWCHESGHTVGVRILEWAGSKPRKRVVPREWAHGGCAYT